MQSTNGILRGDEGHWTSTVWCGRVWTHRKVTAQLTILQLYCYLCPLCYLVLTVITFCTRPGSCVSWNEVAFFFWPDVYLQVSLPCFIFLKLFLFVCFLKYIFAFISLPYLLPLDGSPFFYWLFQLPTFLVCEVTFTSDGEGGKEET